MAWPETPISVAHRDTGTRAGHVEGGSLLRGLRPHRAGTDHKSGLAAEIPTFSRGPLPVKLGLPPRGAPAFPGVPFRVEAAETQISEGQAFRHVLWVKKCPKDRQRSHRLRLLVAEYKGDIAEEQDVWPSLETSPTAGCFPRQTSG